MLVGPAKALFMDEISAGLDSSMTFHIMKFMKQMVHIMDVTMIISLLQPPLVTYDTFDDGILLLEGQVVYQGPRENVLEFFKIMGFKCPETFCKRFFRQFLAFFSTHQMALSFYRFIVVAGRTTVVAKNLGTFTFLLVFILGRYIAAKDDIEPFMIWGYYVSPMSYGQNAVAVNEFLDDRWSTPIVGSPTGELTVGKALLRARGLYTNEYMYWVCIGVLFALSVLFNVLFILALAYLSPMTDTKTTIVCEDEENNNKSVSEGCIYLHVALLRYYCEALSASRSFTVDSRQRRDEYPKERDKEGLGFVGRREMDGANYFYSYYLGMMGEIESGGIAEVRTGLEVGEEVGVDGRNKMREFENIVRVYSFDVAEGSDLKESYGDGHVDVVEDYVNNLVQWSSAVENALSLPLRGL
ncbi:hypothetical protein GIB67_019994 [Kingdonia uniflora]|uniref:Uncharacterized protein n=1 Tax=Kingdonia uniflora TaxID=39325 RepID=A0A7J7ML53_9MAGN|nr:hypothetical protein GIB67_019994 [Kingdonia uniflora]